MLQEAAQEPDEDTAELGMAANSILQSIPRHVLKALEQQQVEANAVNAESRVKLHQLVITFVVLHMLGCFLLLFVSHAVCKAVLSTLVQRSLVKTACPAKISKINMYLSEKYEDSSNLLAVRCVLEWLPKMHSQVKRKKKKTANAPATLGSMRIITGSAAGRRLVSPPGEGTRPMMEKVRGAVFSMVASMAGSQPLLPPGSRWLDLFAGTGEASFCFFWLCCCGACQVAVFCLCSGHDGIICHAMAYRGV